MIKNMILLLILCLPSFATAKNADAPDLPVTYFSDLKGDGHQEKIVATSNAENEIEVFVYDHDSLVYQLPYKPVGTLTAFRIEPLRKGKTPQIYIAVWCNDAAGSFVRVVEWVDGKYQETFSPKETRGVSVEDLEKDGIQQIISYGDKYSDNPPDVYDFDPTQKRYVISNSKHLAFFHQMIDEYEENIKKFPETGDHCCTRTTNLGKMVNAALIIGDTEKAKEAATRLSDVYVEYGKILYHKKRYLGATLEYSKAIEKKSDNFTAFGLRGYSYLRNHQVKEAVDSLEHSVALNPKYIDGYYNLALAYWAQSQEKVVEHSFRKEAAVEQMQKAVDLDPSVKKRMQEDPQFKPIIKFIGKSNWNQDQFSVVSDEKL